MKKLGMEKPMLLTISLASIYLRVIDDILHVTPKAQQQALITHYVTECSIDFIKKWVDCNDKEREDEFRQDMIEVFCKVSKKMKLKYVCRETISECLERLYSESLKDYQKESE